MIGLAVTHEGIPVRCWCWPGITTDQAIMPEVRDRLRGWRLGRASGHAAPGMSRPVPGQVAQVLHMTANELGAGRGVPVGVCRAVRGLADVVRRELDSQA